MLKVAIIMGSDSDLPVMKEAARALDSFGIGYEIKFLSAHRTHEETREYVASAPGKGIGAIIAGAGGAAHLPGVIAALTNMPVIGVPVKAWSLEGLDSLLSIAQM
ncbi:MAG TPA: 5-(carboxyamino)imidazole ribonucleotide mutase, partial [Elusimicrobiales bacterium]|nr:5-(carboxyamino)imidazole ribonucleotide mutase [Elusimicrobiales bacterium]